MKNSTFSQYYRNLEAVSENALPVTKELRVPKFTFLIVFLGFRDFNKHYNFLLVVTTLTV